MFNNQSSKESVQEYLENFFLEKNIPYDEFELMDEDENLHLISTDVIIDSILNTESDLDMKIIIANKTIEMDFLNADGDAFTGFLKHIARYIIN